MMYRCVCLGIASVITLVFSEPSGPDPVTRLEGLMRMLDASLENYAHSAVLRSNDTEAINKFFISILKRNSFIQTIVRIGADGEVINYIDTIGADHVSRNMKGERWFAALASGHPYTVVSRDPREEVVLFRAWPLTESNPATPRFAGAFTIRVDLKKYLQATLVGDSGPMKIFFRGTLLFSRPGDGTGEYVEDTLRITASDELTVHYLPSESIKERPAAKEPLPKALSLKQSKSDTKRKRSGAGSVKRRMSPSKRGKTRVTAAKPDSASSIVADSILTANLVRSSNRSLVAFMVIIVTMFMAVIFFLFVVVRKTRLSRRGEKELHTTLSRLEPIEAIVIQDKDLGDEEKRILSQAVEEDETEVLDEIMSVEGETRAIPALKEFVAASSRKLLEFNPRANPDERSRIFHELQNQIHRWIAGEFKQLSGHLNQLAQVIRECEKNHPGAGELQELRREIDGIVEEVEILEIKSDLQVTARR